LTSSWRPFATPVVSTPIWIHRLNRTVVLAVNDWPFFADDQP